MLHIVNMQKAASLGHIIIGGEKYEVQKLIITRKMKGKRGIGRKQHSWIRNHCQWTRISKAETIFYLAEAGDYV